MCDSVIFLKYDMFQLVLIHLAGGLCSTVAFILQFQKHPLLSTVYDLVVYLPVILSAVTAGMKV